MKKIMIITRLAFLAILLLMTPIVSFGTVEENSIEKQLLTIKAYDPSGTWNVEIELPDETTKMIMIISKDDEGEFEISMEDTAEDETVELDEISFDEEDMTLTAEVEVDGSTVEIALEFDGDSVEGMVYADGMEFELTGERETD